MARSKKTPNKKPSSASTSYFIGNKEYRIRLKLLRMIKKLQMSTELCIPKLSFSRLIRELLQSHSRGTRDLRIQKSALQALHEASEAYLTALFADSNLLAAHAHRVTIKPGDMALCMYIRREKEGG
ncbi:uncharacterized protein LOC662206 [Tribolium castaneum]|uniref:Centromere-specific histone H3 n=1 Tax=Tribolium castaneum TaxID=7070 RepID=D6X3A9_TRICA|nr:PREDICTED: histone H3.3 [Tribolium castaneum]EFA10354.1 Histone H3-like Protein [Tribolium castaneum]QOP57343.1 centromere-specific histone H3 [Tribolium castaneum]|eukprot:XP_973413.1 PREDICTED: histone H3.3 [Tribolium castaneum]